MALEICLGLRVTFMEFIKMASYTIQQRVHLVQLSYEKEHLLKNIVVANVHTKILIFFSQVLLRNLQCLNTRWVKVSGSFEILGISHLDQRGTISNWRIWIIYKQNCRIWRKENPEIKYENPSQRIAIWSISLSGDIIGSYFLKNLII